MSEDIPDASNTQLRCILLHPPSDLVNDLGAEPDNVEGVKDGDRVGAARHEWCSHIPEMAPAQPAPPRR